MQHRKKICLFVICLILFPGLIFAKSSSALVDKGNDAYEKKQYDDALKAYESAGMDLPESAEIYFNKGTVYYRKGEYAKAKEAWEKSALNSKEIILEARSLFNLGNTAFQEAHRQQDNDPQKSLDACIQSIGYYQQVLDLLRNPANAQDPALVKDASENIELVRLTMKSIIDAMAKQQEQAKQQQQTVEELKELIKKQQELIDRNHYYDQEKQGKADTRELSYNISQMAGDQDRLRDETKNTAEKLSSSDPNQADSMVKAKEHLNHAQSEQQLATDKMSPGDLADAGPHQESALKELKEALETLGKDNGQDGQEEKQNQQNQQEEAQKESTQQEQESSDSRHQPEQQQQQQQDKNQEPAKWVGRTPDDAQSILDEEKENQKNRLPEASGGYRDVDKDW
jgi:hypothetical protein